MPDRSEKNSEIHWSESKEFSSLVSEYGFKKSKDLTFDDYIVFILRKPFTYYSIWIQKSHNYVSICEGVGEDRGDYITDPYFIRRLCIPDFDKFKMVFDMCQPAILFLD